MTEIENFRRQHEKKSAFDLYVLRQAVAQGSVERQVIEALIEQRKDRRDWWTLLAALIGAVTGVVAVLWQIVFASQ